MRKLQRKRSEEDNEAQGRLKRMCSASQETWRVEDEFSLSIFHPSGGLAISFVVFLCSILSIFPSPFGWIFSFFFFFLSF